MTFSDLVQSVIDDVARIRTHPLVPASVAIYGYIYHIHHGNLEPVLEANRVGAPRTGSDSEPERKAFNAIVDTQFSDVVRPFTPGPGVYTYWDYTQLRFPKKQGMRIDFILASPALAGRVAAAQIVREERKGKAPSDHAPVVVDLRRD